MKALWEKWTSFSLIVRILVGLAIGAVLALLVPGISAIEMLGTLFVSGLKSIAPVLVFFLIIGALANAKTHGNMGTVVTLYVISTFIAGLLAVVASFLFPSTLVLSGGADAASAPTGIGEVIVNLLTGMVSNPIDAIAHANYLGILLWAALLGIALRFANDTTKAVMQDVANAVSVVVRWIINMAPFGIMGLVYSTVSTSGLDVFTTYGHVVLVLVAVMLVAALITNPLIVYLAARVNPYPLVLRCLKDSAVTAFFTRSSAANIPVNMKLCEDLGLDKDTYSVSIPLGATINMAGACITISVMTMAAAHTMGIQVDFASAVLLCVLSAVGACGASGVAGGSLLLIPLACSLFGIAPEISAQVIAIGFIIGVIQDSCETALNSSSDVVFTAAAELRKRRKNGESLELNI